MIENISVDNRLKCGESFKVSIRYSVPGGTGQICIGLESGVPCTFQPSGSTQVCRAVQCADGSSCTVEMELKLSCTQGFESPIVLLVSLKDQNGNEIDRWKKPTFITC